MQKILFFFSLLLMTAGLGAQLHAQEPAPAQSTGTAKPAETKSSSEYLRLAWKASNSDNKAEIDALLVEMTAVYGAEAKEQASKLTNFPQRSDIEHYKVMNDVATAMFVRAESLMHQGKNDQAKALFEEVGKIYPWSQAWDPSRGSYWSVKEKSEASMRTMSGDENPEKSVEAAQGPKSKPKLAFAGKEKIVNYAKYGHFLHEGTPDYHYQVTNKKGLNAASGEAIYPNISAIYKDPAYKKALKDGRLKGSHWDFVNSDDMEAAIFKWATAPEPWGVRLFYLGVIFERAKMYTEALKAYHALVVFFPNTFAWTYWQTPWYPGQAAVAKIQYIVRSHPELHLNYTGGVIQIKNAYDNDTANDITSTRPGVIKRGNAVKLAEKSKAPMGEAVKTLGKGKVQLVQYSNGHWQLLVDKKPYLIKGITYAPAMIGQSPDKGTLTNWMEEDMNKNKDIDAPYEAWLDKNGNNIQDKNEPSIGDFALMKEMGVNTLRLYHHPLKPNKDLLRRMHRDYGFMLIMGDFLGKYAIGSGASWTDGTDYENPEHRAKMMETVKAMVMEYKDEPFVLMWLLGNENNYGVASNADKKPEVYYKFVNDVAKMIKSIDPNHPVAVCNGDTLYLDKFGQLTPDVDVYAGNVYRGNYGFGSFWQQVAEITGKPAFISEYGAPSFGGTHMTYDEAQAAQADYHRGNWMDIQYNSAGYPDGAGNAIGGVAFEWLDEWWKNYEPSRHDTKADVIGPFPGGYYYEEWFGLMGQGDGKNSPLMREHRKVFDTYKKLWNN